MASATSGVAARAVSWSMPSRTSVTSENITVAPARTSRSVAKAHRRVGGDAGERIAAAALHAHHQLAGRHGLAAARVQPLQVHTAPGAGWNRSSTHEADMLLVLQADHVELAGEPGVSPDRGICPLGSRRSGCSFSQPRLTTITSPPKFGFRLMLRSVRIGIGRVGRVDGHAAAVAVLQRRPRRPRAGTGGSSSSGCAARQNRRRRPRTAPWW
jgi:hypothetical protein